MKTTLCSLSLLCLCLVLPFAACDSDDDGEPAATTPVGAWSACAGGGCNYACFNADGRGALGDNVPEVDGTSAVYCTWAQDGTGGCDLPEKDPVAFKWSITNDRLLLQLEGCAECVDITYDRDAELVCFN